MDLLRCTKCKYITDLSGYGAFKYGGRWNSPGTLVVYTASNPSLALLETLVHMNPILPDSDYCLIKLTLETNSILTVYPESLISSWQKTPAHHSLKTIGDEFVKDAKYLLLKVPSAVLPIEWNYLINPKHPLFASIRLGVPTKLEFDQRLTAAVK